MASALETLFKQNPMLAKGIIYQAAAEKSLVEFIKLMWEVVEPGREYVHNWHVDAIADHLQAVTRGEIKKLLINISPGLLKTLSTNVFWPAWEWIDNPYKRYVTFSYSQDLTKSANIKFQQIITSDVYRSLWGDRFKITTDNIVEMANDKRGFKIASSIGAGGTGKRGDVIILDDPNNVKEAESKLVRDETNRWFKESLPTRINDPRTSAMVVIQQRTNDADVSGVILSGDDRDWVHLMIPMEFDSARKCSTFIGWEDPRTEDGELCWPEIYDATAVEKLKSVMGSYASASQFQQSPVPRGGGIILEKWWKMWPKEGEAFDDNGNPLRPLEYPEMDYILVSVDSAYTEKEENDYSAAVVLGLYREDGQPRIILMDAWQKRMRFHGTVPEKRKGESRKDYLARDEWGLVELVAYTAHTMRADKVLVENKASGISLIQEIRRLYSNEKFSVQAVNPKGDKVARAHAVSSLFENGVISAPNRWWSQVCIEQVSMFPRGAHDDICDALIHGVKHLRDTGWALRTNEYEEEIEPKEFRGKEGVLYDV